MPKSASWQTKPATETSSFHPQSWRLSVPRHCTAGLFSFTCLTWMDRWHFVCGKRLRLCHVMSTRAQRGIFGSLLFVNVKHVPEISSTHFTPNKLFQIEEKKTQICNLPGKKKNCQLPTPPKFLFSAPFQNLMVGSSDSFLFETFCPVFKGYICY